MNIADILSPTSMYRRDPPGLIARQQLGRNVCFTPKSRIGLPGY